LPFSHYKEHVIRKFQENQQELEFNGTHQVLANKTDVGLMDIQNIQQQEILDASSKVRKAVN